MNEQEMFYRKVGRRYKPVGFGEFPHLTKGCHLVVVGDNWTSTIFDIDPDVASLRAIEKLVLDKVVKIVAKAGEGRCEQHNNLIKTSKKYKQQCEAAWKAYTDIMGEGASLTYWYPSAHEVAQEIVRTLLEEAERISNGEQ